MSIRKITGKLTFALVAAAMMVVPGSVLGSSHGIDLSGKTVEWVIPFSEYGG